MRGIRTQIKKTKILNHLNKLNADICLLQETHLTDSELQYLKTKQYDQVFSSTYNSRQRGVSILVHKRLGLNQHTVITDPEGRYVIVNATIYNHNLTIVNVYGPNDDDPSFFHNLFSIIQGSSNIIIGGDFNTVLNPDKDRSTAKYKNWQTTDTINQYMSDFGLGDSWRTLYPSDRKYTYFSTVHQSFSRLDYFLISNTLTTLVKQIIIHPIIISDHAPVSLTLSMNPYIKPPPRWRFNISLLDNPEFTTLIEREWASFMEMNDSPEVSASTLWETGKVVIRGKIISYSSQEKKRIGIGNTVRTEDQAIIRQILYKSRGSNIT